MTKESTAKRRTGRPSTEARLERPERVPVGGHRDKLTVQGQDANMAYRWVLDMDATGGNILKYMQGGWEFTPADQVVVGQTYVFSSEDYGAIVRKPANKQGDFYYLMNIPKELFDQDKAAKQEIVNVW